MGVALLGNAWTVVFRSLVGSSVFGMQRVRADEVDADAAVRTELSQELVRELDRLAKRKYSEEGIPMFLACDNLVRAAERPAIGAAELTSNAPLLAAFRRYADALPQARANVSDGDVAKIVELLADQDFASGGRRYAP
jgi:hypothetical protein